MHRFAFPSVTPTVMILSCPECGTQYTLKESQLGPRGRTVRCAACKHTWHAEIPIDLRFSEPKSHKDEPAEDLQSVKAKKLPGKYRAMLEDKKRMRAMAVEFAMWGGMAALALVVLALGYFLRVDIVKAFPRVAGAYAMVGLQVKGTNLRFDEKAQVAQVVLKGGRFVVTVQAKVTNIGDKPEPVPPVRAKMQDASLQPFGSILLPAGDLVVEPHATRTLTFDIADPMNKVAHLDLDFDLEAMKKAQKGKKPTAAGHHALAAGSDETGHAPETVNETVTESPHEMADATPHAAEPVAAPMPAADAVPQDNDVSTQVTNTDTPAQSLSRKPAHPLRGALSFSDDGTHTIKASHRESKS